MSYEVLIVLFLLLSVVSSLINKMKEHRDKQRREEDRPYIPLSRRTPLPELGEEDAPLPEWDVLQELDRHRRAPVDQEFQEVQGKRTVSGEDTGPEFQEVTPTRDVEEPEGVEEWREVHGSRPVSGTSPFADAQGPPVTPLPTAEEAMARPLKVRRRRGQGRCYGRLRLHLGHRALQRAIVLNEVLGPPRADRMPW